MYLHFEDCVIQFFQTKFFFKLFSLGTYYKLKIIVLSYV